ncbi:hypothetical protein R6Q57_002349 [Mikania cordata]
MTRLRKVVQLNTLRDRETCITRGARGWCNELAEQHWEDNITDELNKEKSNSGGDDTIDEVEVLECSLGKWHGHIRDVCRTVKSVTPDFLPHMYASTNELQQQLVEANVCWEEQQHINEMMHQQINKLM